ncbi:hypothetical protein P43SY_002270 [Pythium insidiosum]|uniref:RING-type domain-containing protein n=1 Tax=Pythium insidiosum TaxID=114742 RepID=A0AAD5Q5V8_PYTIN|nr:hypothetical protein P43SY_002270 [Pythium insidiosum]
MHSHKRCPGAIASPPSYCSSRSVDSNPMTHAALRLEHISFELTASVKRSDVRYELHAFHRTTRTRWTLSRSFDEYRSFQKRLLAAMQQGHTCHAECPWLYSFVTSYFPRSALFRSSSSCVVQKRQDALEKCLRQIHAFLLNRQNHLSCAVTQEVAREFTSFIMNDDAELSLLLQSADSSSISTEKEGRASSSSVLSSTDDESEDDAHCVLCSENLASATNCTYTTVLDCGHEFHDECIVSHLNKALSCPVCGHHVH